ncbi:MAG: F0F1 ATP synthase subunit A [Candidatus Saccharimonadales bacterium]
MQLFASAIQVPPIKAENLFNLGPIVVRNSTLLGAVVLICSTIFLIWVTKKISIRPTKNRLAAAVEAICDYVMTLMTEVIGDRRRALKYAPLVLTLFFLILLNNWAGLLPGVGHSLLAHTHEGHVPFLRGFTSDLNSTLALALVTMFLVQVYSIKELGGLGYFKHFFTDKPYNPINLFVGLLELLGEFTKVMSLSLRLFGNIFAGEVLLFVITSITGYLAPVATMPFVLMEMFAGFIQAFVFAMLTLVYLTIATSKHDDHEAETAHIKHDLSTAVTKNKVLVASD